VYDFDAIVEHSVVETIVWKRFEIFEFFRVDCLSGHVHHLSETEMFYIRMTERITGQHVKSTGRSNLLLYPVNEVFFFVVVCFVCSFLSSFPPHLSPFVLQESDYFTPQGEFRVDKAGSPTLLNCLMYKMSYYRFGEMQVRGGRVLSKRCLWKELSFSLL